MAHELEITQVDPFDTAAVNDWHDAYTAADQADRSDAPVWTLEESRAELQQTTNQVQRRIFVARRRDAVVAAARLALPLQDNTHRAELGIYVPATFRRQGIASDMLVELEQQARAAGRTTVTGEASWPYQAGTDGAGSPGREFAQSHGYTLALGDVERRLQLPVPLAHLDRLAGFAAPHHADYTLHNWSGPVPDEFVAGWAALDASLETEAPVGDLDLMPSTADVDTVREQESLFVEQRRTSYSAAAVDNRGMIAAYTQLVVSHHDGMAYQWGTLVSATHRGHRLGLAVKTANLQRVQQSGQTPTAVITFNADSNTHMNAVNEKIGFVPVARMGEFQKKLG